MIASHKRQILTFWEYPIFRKNRFYETIPSLIFKVGLKKGETFFSNSNVLGMLENSQESLKLQRVEFQSN